MDRKTLINEVLSIDESRDPWIKISFYSDDEVMRILNSAYRRWEEGGLRGYPIDYLSDDELRLLYIKSKALSTTSVISNTIKDMLIRLIYGEVPKKPYRTSGFMRSLLKLIIPVRSSS